jgi:hypothetical protein
MHDPPLLHGLVDVHWLHTGVNVTASDDAANDALFLPGSVTPRVPPAFSMPCVCGWPSVWQFWHAMVMMFEVSSRHTWVVTLAFVFPWCGTLVNVTQNCLLGVDPLTKYVMDPPCDGSRFSQYSAMRLFGAAASGIACS